MLMNVVYTGHWSDQGPASSSLNSGCLESEQAWSVQSPQHLSPALVLPGRHEQSSYAQNTQSVSKPSQYDPFLRRTGRQCTESLRKSVKSFDYKSDIATLHCD